MGSLSASITCHPTKNVITLHQLHQELSTSTQLSTVSCPIYGIVHSIQYHTHQLMIQQLPNTQQGFIDSYQNNFSNSSLNKQILQNPPAQYIHFLVNSNLIVIPPYIPFEEYKIETYNQELSLLNLLKEISEICLVADVGLGRNKLGLPKIDIKQMINTKLGSPETSKVTAQTKWKILGFDYSNPYWNYQALMQHSLRQSDAYLSPQLMYAFSKDKIYPKVDIKKSDVFVLAIMALQILFEEDLLKKIYQYNSFEIKLKPILSKLSAIEEKFSEFTYRLFVKMLQFDPAQRICFEQIISEIQEFQNNKKSYLSPLLLDKQSQNAFKTVTPLNCKPKTGSPFLKECEERDRQTRNRGRSPGAIRKNFQGSDNSFSVSPCHSRRKQSNPLIKVTPGSFGLNEKCVENRSPAVQPFGLFQRSSNQLNQARRESDLNLKGGKFRAIRY